jgi:citrate lyase subunit beta/citryl-CoA lyase
VNDELIEARSLAKPRRSALYAPGSSAAVLTKALNSAADVLIFDLEDAVSPDSKIKARETVVEILSGAAPARREIVVRVNAIGSPWCEDDVRAVAQLGVSAILFPKVCSEDDVRAAESMMDVFGASPATRLWCMIETPLAILNAHAIARLATHASSRMGAWVIGTNDLVKELRAAHTPTREPLLTALSMALLAARAYGIAVLDGVHNDFRDLAGLEDSCRQGLAMGFDGKTLIHPTQIAPCNLIYSPTDEAVRHARAVIAAFDLPENRGKGVLSVDGRMVELLHADIARQTLEIADAIAGQGR